MPDDAMGEEKGQIPTNLRLLLILEEVARRGVPVSAAALSEAMGLPKPTIHRLLTTAEEQGFVQRDIDGRSYGPGPRLRHMAGNTLSSEQLRTERQLILKRLASDVGETCNIAVPDRAGMVYLDRVETHWPLRIQLPVGTQVPFHCTASGKLYLSSLRPDKLRRTLSWIALDARTPHTLTSPDALVTELASIRSRGHSSDDEEFMAGMVAVAVPIRDHEGRLLTTLSIHAPKPRQSVESLETALPALRAAAARLEELL